MTLLSKNGLFAKLLITITSEPLFLFVVSVKSCYTFAAISNKNEKPVTSYYIC